MGKKHDEADFSMKRYFESDEIQEFVRKLHSGNSTDGRWSEVLRNDNSHLSQSSDEVNRIRSSLCLYGARLRKNLDAQMLSDKTGIPKAVIEEMEDGRQKIGEYEAEVFGEALGVDFRVFL
jgi:hypothetical protein